MSNIDTKSIDVDILTGYCLTIDDEEAIEELKQIFDYESEQNTKD